MRLAEGIVLDNEKTFGVLKFSGLRREVFAEDSEGNRTSEVERRTYDLRSSVQGMMIQVSIPADVPLKEFDYKAEVELVEPELSTIANSNYRGADVGWYLEAKDMVLKKAGGPSGRVQQKDFMSGKAQEVKDEK